MTFLYFAYGSNMLTQRMCINCPSAKFKAIAELKKFKLVFSGFSTKWKGCAATILQSDNDSVWGVIWEISKEHEESLNKQEKGYQSFTVDIFSTTLGEVQCKCYRMVPRRFLNILNLGLSLGLPSLIYKKVMVQGATEHGLPLWYIEKLDKLEDNGYKGPIAIPVDITL